MVSQGLVFTGFDTEQELPLFAHKSTNLVERGGVATRVRIRNPKHHNEGETAMLERKAAMGWMPWPPGEECLSRTFRDIKIVRDVLTNTTRREASASYQGCKWCRAESNIGLQGEAEEQAVVSENSESSYSPPNDPAPPVTDLSCSVCGFSPAAQDRGGRSRSMKQRRHAMTLHTKTKHK